MYTEFSHYLLFLAIFTILSFSISICLKRFLLLFYLIFTSSLFGILSGYVCSDFGIYNIFTNSNINTPFFFKISATWSNHEGSLLLWCWLLSFSGFLFCLLKQPVGLHLRPIGLLLKLNASPLGSHLRASPEVTLVTSHASDLRLLLKQPITRKLSHSGWFSKSSERLRCNKSFMTCTKVQGCPQAQRACAFVQVTFVTCHSSDLWQPRIELQRTSLAHSLFQQSYFRANFLFFFKERSQFERAEAKPTLPYNVYSLIIMFFATFLVYTSNPFLKIPFASSYSIAELNPVLQDPVLAIHPPCIYAGYVASAICFSLSLSIMFWVQRRLRLKNSLESKKDQISLCYDNNVQPQLKVLYSSCFSYAENGWKLLRIWILASWSFLTFGILLGSWWAYHELGWGGWWFWDPVENASLEPWLMATACIHSITQQKLTYWTLILSSSAFVLSVLGTFFVRSGLLASVHSFATDSTRGLYLLFFLVLTFFVFLYLFLKFAEATTSLDRKKLAEASFSHFSKLKDSFKVSSVDFFLLVANANLIRLKNNRFFFSSQIEQILCLQNFFFCIISVVVLCGTSAPILFQWIWSRDVSTGAPFYNGMLIPLFTSLLVVLVYTHYTQLKPKSGWLNQLKIFEWLKQPFSFIDIIFLCCTFLNFFFFYSFFRFSLLESTYGTISFLFILSFFLLKNNIFLYEKRDRESKFQPSRLIAHKVGNFQKSMKIAHSAIVVFLTGILFSNTNKIQFTQLMQKGSQIRLGQQHLCCLRSIDQNYGPTFHSICGNLLVYQKSDSSTEQGCFSKARQLQQPSCKPKGVVTEVTSRLALNFRDKSKAIKLASKASDQPSSMSEAILPENMQRPNVTNVTGKDHFSMDLLLSKVTSTYPSDLHHLCMFPEKRFFFTNQNFTTTKVAIHTNFFTDFYSLIGTGSFETGWFTTIMKLPFIFCIWLGFFLATIGGVEQLKRLLQKSKLEWI
uniref:Heme lyase n=1 Tax=Gonatozygon brebissonii TaxID=184482 RepID=A0A6G9IG66_9VIRI|nr:heme lyase [Gonatozygon brebissonii]QIQ23061.1 heme lyase [Gonatozygon brebissonii]